MPTSTWAEILPTAASVIESDAAKVCQVRSALPFSIQSVFFLLFQPFSNELAQCFKSPPRLETLSDTTFNMLLKRSRRTSGVEYAPRIAAAYPQSLQPSPEQQEARSMPSCVRHPPVKVERGYLFFRHLSVQRSWTSCYIYIYHSLLP